MICTGFAAARERQAGPCGRAFVRHRQCGPKGMGAWYVSRHQRVHLQAQMHGGGHERGLRSGTLATHQIVGMGEAYRIAQEEMATDEAKARALRQRLLDGLRDVAD